MDIGFYFAIFIGCITGVILGNLIVDFVEKKLRKKDV
jgi:uncharacterized membrane-anchored protein YhcB (DUF1043 family)